jgi:hypothetical protein
MTEIRWHRQACIALLFGALTAPSQAQTVQPPATSALDAAQQEPGVRRLQFPPVTPEEAQRYFSARTAQPAIVPRAPAAPGPELQPSRVPQAVNVETVIGRTVPPDRAAPTGFSRADFASKRPRPGEADNVAGTGRRIEPRSSDTPAASPQLPVIMTPEGPIVVPADEQ